MVITKVKREWERVKRVGNGELSKGGQIHGNNGRKLDFGW